MLYQIRTNGVTIDVIVRPSTRKDEGVSAIPTQPAAPKAPATAKRKQRYWSRRPKTPAQAPTAPTPAV